MATKFKLQITTPHGVFTRTATRPYMFAVVRTSERAMESHLEIAAGRAIFTSGVHGRWHKDRGFAVTWHGSEAAARAVAAKPYMWDNATGPAEVYPMEAA